MTDGINPKDEIGQTKLPLGLIPPVALIEAALAHFEGNQKYGPFNWRDNRVIASVYTDAILRHLFKWMAGRERDPVSGAHELGHVIACCNILIDAQRHDCLADDRVKSPEFPALLEAARERMKDCKATIDPIAAGVEQNQGTVIIGTDGIHPGGRHHGVPCSE